MGHAGEKLPLKLGCTVKEEPVGAYLQDGITLADGAIRLYCCTKTDFVWDALQGNMIGLILILLVTITFALILVRYIYLQILSPWDRWYACCSRLTRRSRI